MRKTLALAAFLVAADAVAAERLLGTITATTTKNNSDTAVTFTIPSAAKLSIQCDVAAYVVVGTGSSTASTSATGVTVQANALFLTATGNGQNHVAILPVSGTANCKVYERNGNEG